MKRDGGEGALARSPHRITGDELRLLQHHSRVVRQPKAHGPGGCGTAEQLHGPEREEAWQRIATATSQFEKYQVKTDRELPIIRLTRRAG